MLSNTCKYAIRSCVYIAIYGKDRLMIIKDVAKGLSVPEPFLGKIMQTLAKHKILHSQRGIDGGFKFAKDPHKISFLDIIEIFDGLDIFNECVLGIRICSVDKKAALKCPFHKSLDPLQEKFYKVFKENTIGDFADKLDDYKDFVLI